MQITVLNSINFAFSEIKHFFKQNQLQMKFNWNTMVLQLRTSLASFHNPHPNVSISAALFMCFTFLQVIQTNSHVIRIRRWFPADKR